MADNSKGTISLWFRFSQDAIDAVTAYANSYRSPDFGDFGIGTEVFARTIPLVTFGRKVMSHTYGAVAQFWTQVAGGAVLTATSFDPVVKPDSPCEPSHIGLELNEIPGVGYDGTVSLKMRFQTATWATAQGFNTHVTNIHWQTDFPFSQYTTVEDASYTRNTEPASFLIKPKFHVDPGKWHHLLVSFDLSTSVDVTAITPYIGISDEADWMATIKSYCKVWYAFDDENKNGKDNIGHDWAPQDPNGIVPTGAKQAAYSYDSSPPDPFVTGGTENVEYHWAASPVPLNGGPVGLPASAEYVDTIYHCELAEFQFFAGITLDTGDTSKRRAFIGQDGTPVDPTGTEDDSAPAVKLLGKRPDILLHGSGDWKSGSNTGATGIKIETDGSITKLPNGQFTPTGGIEAYKPDPSL